MSSDLKKEDILMRVRGKLNDENIKLWQPPYYDQNNGICMQELQKLANVYVTTLVLDFDTILAALKELQVHSIERFKANSEYKESGLATLRIRASMPQHPVKMINLQIQLTQNGKDLMAALAGELSLDVTRVKLIHSGCLIKEELKLCEQGVKNGALILALMLPGSPKALKEEDKMYHQMREARDDAVLLSESTDSNDYVQLEDQSGNVVDVPESERRALVVGLALHEKGRAAMRVHHYDRALVLLVEADSQFNECGADILRLVDNPGLLQLDIAWCYLCVGSLSHASDAEVRLRRAEDALRRSYGDKMERLMALKGNTVNERTLLMRLYLLQGIVKYHQNKRAQAKELLDKAEFELQGLRVDEVSASVLIALGFTAGEARLGLRACRGDVDAAASYVRTQRDERWERRRKAREDKEARLLGRCSDGTQWISPPFVRRLEEMGFERALCIAALRLSNNHVSEAVRLIQEQPQLFADVNKTSDFANNTVDKELLTQLSGMGYSRRAAHQALQEAHNQLPDAVDLLIAQGGAAVLSNQSGEASTSIQVDESSHSSDEEKEKRRAEENAAYSRLAADVAGEDDDHLNSTLDQELEFLTQYRQFLQ